MVTRLHHQHSVAAVDAAHANPPVRLAHRLRAVHRLRGLGRPLAAAIVAAGLTLTGHARADDPPASSPPAEWLDESAAPASSPPATPADPADGASSAAPAAAPAARKTDAVSPVVRAVVHHAPMSTAQAGSDFVVDVILEDPHLARGIELLHRLGKGPIVATPFARSVDGYRAVIEGAKVGEGLAYAIELELQDGRRVAVFASREDLHPVQVLPDAMDEHERTLLASLGGRRSRAAISTEYVDFGSTTTRAGERTDRYWGVEGRYTYRPLRTVAEFGFRGGVVRGTSPSNVDPGTGEQPDVGLNYGASSVRIRFADLWHMELEGLASISDEGFSTGGGTKLLVGNPYGSKLVLGASFVGVSEATYFGSKFFSRVDLAASERVTVSPTIEITDMPNADRYGVRLLAEVDVEIGGGFSAQINGGYQARRAASGGPGIGGGVTLDF